MRKLIYNIWRPFAIFWSNLYWRIKHAHYDYKVRICDLMRKTDNSISDYIKRSASNVLNKFEYKHDGVEELGDTIPPPAEAYYQYVNGVLKDDCDGFHACLYHLAKANGIESKLIEVFSLNNLFGHCVLAFKDGDWKICDYDCIMTLEEAREYYKTRCNGEYVEFDVEFDKRYINKKGLLL